MATIQDKKHRKLEELSVSASRAFVESGLFGIEAEVVVALDTSPGMAPLFASGTVQDVASALLALAMRFDDDGVVPVWTFDEEATHRGEIKRSDHSGWVRQHVPPPAVVPEGEVASSARFAPLVDAIGRRYFPKEWGTKGVPRVVGDRLKRTVFDYPGPHTPRACPVFVIIVTCGECADPLETTKLLRRASFLPVFWQFAALTPAVAHDGFKFLRGVDHLPETHCDSAGFFEPDVSAAGRQPVPSLGVDALYQGLLNELPQWLALPQVQQMLQQPEARDPSDDGIDAALLTLPAAEAAKRERARIEREQRRIERANMAQLEMDPANAWPTIRTSSEIDAAEEDPVVRSRGEGPPSRVHVGTTPYTTSEGMAPVLPPRRPTASFAAHIEPAQPEDNDDETTVETAIERLARIRARRNARKPD